MHIQILKQKIIILAIAILTITAIFFVAGCKFGLQEAFYRAHNVNERCAELTAITLPTSVTTAITNKGQKYNFMIFTDVHYGAEHEVPERQILNWIDSFNTSTALQAQKPLFCIVLGDIVETGAKEDYAHFETFQDKIENKGIPVYCVVGNHDLLNSGWEYWKTSCNPHTSFYRFQTNGISWYFTDTGSGTMGNKQLDILESAIKNDANRKIVFSHYPLYGGGAGIPMFAIENDKERARLIDLYARNNVKYVFEGHWHYGRSYDFGSFKELIGESLKNDKLYLISMDETTSSDTNPVTKVEEINLNSF